MEYFFSGKPNLYSSFLVRGVCPGRLMKVVCVHAATRLREWRAIGFLMMKLCSWSEVGLFYNRSSLSFIISFLFESVCITITHQCVRWKFPPHTFSVKFNLFLLSVVLQIVIPFFSLLIKDIYFLNEGCANRLQNGQINFEVNGFLNFPQREFPC